MKLIDCRASHLSYIQRLQGTLALFVSHQTIIIEWLREFGRQCPRCGVYMVHGTKHKIGRKDRCQLPSNYATIDHVLPKARGGTDDPANLQVLCHRCNHTKADT